MKKRSRPEWLERAVFYQVYPQSFYDSNSDGVGDIPGIIEKLDYLEWLGINAIWINPCFESPFSDVGYDISDYCKVAPRYGTNDDLVRLFKEAHKRGIKICLDLVPGHTSIEHPWFKESCRHKKNKYSDYYIWSSSAWDDGSPDMRFIHGFAERDANFAINFFYSQPALNYGFRKRSTWHPWQQPADAPGPRAVRKEMKRVMDFWLKKGADGFRVDMAFSLVKNDEDRRATSSFWSEIREWLNEKYPEAALISEWGNPIEAVRAGFHVDFMLHFGVPGFGSLLLKSGDKPCFFDSRGDGSVTEFLEEYMKQYEKTKGGYISIPTSNHDMGRLNMDRSEKELKVIFTFLLTWPGVPFIYYGEEIGMRYQEGLKSKEGGYGRTGSRTPMQWNNKKNAGFSASRSEKLYLPVDGRKNRPTVESQRSRSGSLLEHVRELIELRKSSPALLSAGKLKLLYAEPGKYPFIYLRQHGREKFLIALNPSKDAVSVLLDGSGIDVLDLITGSGVELDMGKKIKFIMKGVSYAVFRCS